MQLNFLEVKHAASHASDRDISDASELAHGYEQPYRLLRLMHLHPNRPKYGKRRGFDGPAFL